MSVVTFAPSPACLTLLCPVFLYNGIQPHHCKMNCLNMARAMIAKQGDIFSLRSLWLFNRVYLSIIGISIPGSTIVCVSIS